MSSIAAELAIIGGGVLVALINVYLFRGVEELAEPQKARIYQQVYAAALVVPLLSVSGVLLASYLRHHQRRRLRRRGLSAAAGSASGDPTSATAPNWWILGGSLVFAAFSVGVGVSGIETCRLPPAQEEVAQ